MTRTDLIEHLWCLEACDEAQEWVAGTPGTPEELWAACKRGDWLLWLAANAGVDRRVVVSAACDCVETATPHLTDSTRGPALAALETARRWARREATSAEVNHASYAAACVATLCTSVDHAAMAAANVAYAANVACATYTAAATERAACATRDWAVSLQRSADIVRTRILWVDVEAALARSAP